MTRHHCYLISFDPLKTLERVWILLSVYFSCTLVFLFVQDVECKTASNLSVFQRSYFAVW